MTPQTIFVLCTIAALALSGCAKDLIMDLGHGDSIRFVGQAESFNCDDPKYANVKKIETTRLQFADGDSMRLCTTEEGLAAMAQRPAPLDSDYRHINVPPSGRERMPIRPTVPDDPTAPIVHAIGISEAVNGEALVQVNDTRRPLILVFSAYKKTHWTLKVSPGVTIKKIILSGHETQRISGLAPGIPVYVYTYEHSPCSQCTAGFGSFHSHNEPHKRISEIVGQPVNSFQNGSVFTTTIFRIPAPLLH